MDPDEAVRQHLRLSRAFLASAERDVEAGNFAPARLTLLHALELSLKAALVARTGQPWDTHNVHGPFGQHFRDAVPATTPARVNKLVQEYGKSRYPDWEEPSAREMQADLAFVEQVVGHIVPALVSQGRRS